MLPTSTTANSTRSLPAGEKQFSDRHKRDRLCINCFRQTDLREISMSDSTGRKGDDTANRRDYRAQEDSISLLDLLTVLAKRRGLILGSTVLAAALVVAFSIATVRLPSDSPWNYLPDVYRPTIKVLLRGQSDSSGMISSLISSSALGSLAGLAGIGGGGNPGAQLAIALLEGNDIKDQIAEEFNFTQRYNITIHPRTTARAIVGGSLETKYDANTNMLEISYEETEPAFATDVLTKIVTILEREFSDLSLYRVSTRKRFIEERLRVVGEELGQAQQKLIEFQKRYGVIDMAAEAQERIRLVAQLKGDAIAKEIDLEIRGQYLREDDPQIVRLKNEITKMNQLISELKKGFQEFSGGDTIPYDTINEITPTYLDLKRDLTLQDTIYTMLRQQYETTKLEEADTTETFQVIENAEIPEIKYGPSRSKICIIVTITTFFLAVFLSFVKEYFDRVRLDPAESEKLEALRRMLGRRKR